MLCGKITAGRIHQTIPGLSPYLGVVAAIFIYSLIQTQHFTPAYQEVDPDGYLFLAKRIAHLQSPAVREEDPFMYQSHVWVETQGRALQSGAIGDEILVRNDRSGKTVRGVVVASGEVRVRP